MKRKWIVRAAALVLCTSPWLSPVAADAGVDVDVHIGLPVVPVAPAPPPPPVYVVPEPETLILVPSIGVYFAPGLSVDLFFSGGYWWSHDHGRWWRAHDQRGPWTVVERRRVPRGILSLPPKYRTVYGHHREVPYREWKKHHYREASHREVDRDHGRGEKHREEKRHGKGKHGNGKHRD